MATDFPTSLDNLTNPSSTDTMAEVSHSEQHANANDAIEALQTKVGADSSAVATSLDYLVKNTSSSDPGHKHTLANGATDVTSSAAELNLLDGKTLSGSDTQVITGTAGTDTHVATWNADGDIVNGNSAVADFAASSHTHAEADISDLGTAVTLNADTDVSGNGWVLDQDDMSGDDATKVPTQQSVKAYVDASSSPASGWNSYTAVVPTRSVSDDPTYEITFASVDLTGTLSAGMRMKFTQDGTVRYFIITKVALDGSDTDVTLYGGTDYDVGDTASLTISALSYSPHKAPQGFPLDPTKWQVLVEDTSNRSQATAVQNTWYNAGSISIDIPIGSWNVSYEGIYESSDTNCYITLSTANNSESDKDWTCLNEGTDYNTVHREKFLVLSTKDTYYLNYRTTGAGTPTLILRGDLGTTRIKADCTYL